MGKEPFKEVPKLKEWPHFSGEGEYEHIKFIRGIYMIKEDFELKDRFVKDIFETLLTKSAHRWYIKSRQEHEHQSWTQWKTQTINNWDNDLWRFKFGTAFESEKYNANKDRALPWFCQQKDRPTESYPEMSESMIHRKIMRECEGDLEHVVKKVLLEKFQQKIL
ncbi:hypothetical protein O181_071452 [Austropuccinia psidii MF-1]|uniref:Retrotransposon gag domain-containing protein n=1 Tax=Austropuccinia psidii MF-1 TaxID=1389203 RepID=A0A9Q3F7R2_9BASI|nr:hypothetical protein [Austropuccinia psidii MF-1]